MAVRPPRERRPRETWRVVGGLNVDLPRDPYPFAERWGGAEPRQGGPRPNERRPGWTKGRKLEAVLRELRDEYRASHVEHWPFGPSEEPRAGLVARFAINRKWGLKDSTELQVQLDRRTGRALWIAIRSPKGLMPSEVARLPWANLFTVADAIDKQERSRGRYLEALHPILEMLHTLEARPRPPRAPRVMKRPGRAGHPDEHYAKVAERYLALRGRGVTNPTKTIADEWHQARSTVAGWVHEARERGYLPPAQPGRAG
jgi:hypothetical protein